MESRSEGENALEKVGIVESDDGCADGCVEVKRERLEQGKLGQAREDL